MHGLGERRFMERGGRERPSLQPWIGHPRVRTERTGFEPVRLIRARKPARPQNNTARLKTTRPARRCDTRVSAQRTFSQRNPSLWRGTSCAKHQGVKAAITSILVTLVASTAAAYQTKTTSSGNPVRWPAGAVQFKLNASMPADHARVKRTGLPEAASAAVSSRSRMPCAGACRRSA